jgi:hypothetical protein
MKKLLGGATLAASPAHASGWGLYQCNGTKYDAGADLDELDR